MTVEAEERRLWTDGGRGARRQGEWIGRKVWTRVDRHNDSCGGSGIECRRKVRRGVEMTEM